MLPTHALGGLALGLSVAPVAPEFAGVALVGGLLGGVFPDLDLYAGHRRTLHYPVYYSALAVAALAVVALAPGAVTVGAALFLLGAAVHSVADVFGGGLELRPWEGTSDRAVYDHHRGRWLAPRRLVRYDGSPGDFLLSVALAVPLLVALDGQFRHVVVATLLLGAGYAGVRRTLPDLADVVVPHLPERLLAHVPRRYLNAVSS